ERFAAIAEKRRDGSLERCVPAAVHDEVGVLADEAGGVDAERERLTPARSVALEILPGFPVRPAALHCCSGLRSRGAPARVGGLPLPFQATGEPAMATGHPDAGQGGRHDSALERRPLCYWGTVLALLLTDPRRTSA